VPAPTSCRRGQSAPFDSPPLPSGEWQLGGTPIIGDPGIASPGPLMQALYDGPNGDLWKASKVQFYGWEDFSANLSTSHNTTLGRNNNFPETYDTRSNQLAQNQFVVFIERLPDECQSDHIDWGFRLSGVYGSDYRFLISRGFLSDQLLKRNHYYGYDFPMLYADIYIPWVAQGMNIRIGRICSEPDIESQMAPGNLMASHALTCTFDPYYEWGIFTTTKLDAMWTLQLGCYAGNDVAPWQNDPGRQATGTAMLQWISKNNRDSIYAGANAFNNGEFGYNNVQQFLGTYTHKFNDKVYTATEGWYMFQHNATTGPTASVPFQNGSFPVQAGYAPEWAVLNYTMFRLAGGTFLTVRNEYVDDKVGNRTGFATPYSEHAIGITWWPNKVVTIRPELRFDHSYNVAAFDNGTRKSQFTATCDIIVHF
jgi:hypothetical protein